MSGSIAIGRTYWTILSVLETGTYIYYNGRVKIVVHASECYKMVDFHEEIEFLWMACLAITMKSESIIVNQSTIINGN